MQKSILLVCLLLIPLWGAFAQKNRIKFDNISLEEGLSQSTVTSIYQDKRGFMWFGTLDGLNKYDGYSIKVYRNSLSAPHSIADNSINDIYEDSQEKLWIATLGKGVCLFNKFTEKFTSAQHFSNSEKSIASNNIRCIAEGKDSSLWFGTDCGISKLAKADKEQLIFTNYYNTKATDPAANYINDIVSDNSGFLWLATNRGLVRFDPKEESFFSYAHTDLSPQGVTINTLFLDSKGILWLGTEQGLVKMYKNSAIFTVYQHQSQNPQSLSHNSVTSIIEDPNGMLWVGTKDGLNMFDPEEELFSHYHHDPADNQSLSVDEITTIYQDKANILWIGTSLGGINKWNRAAEDIDVFRYNPYDPFSLSSSLVRTIYQDKLKNIWVGTVGGGLNKWNKQEGKFIHYKHRPNDPTSLTNNKVRNIFEDSKGNFWVGTNGGGLNLFDRQNEIVTNVFRHNPKEANSLSDNRIWKIYEDSHNQLWVATFGGGLNRFNYESETFTIYSHDSTDTKSISDNRTTTILEDHLGNLWVGTYGGGLNLWHPETQSFEHFTFNPKDSMSIGHDRIYSIFEDSDGILWVGTKGSLNRFERSSEKFKRYLEKDGLPNDVIMGILEDRKGNLWISTNRGLSKFNKERETFRNYDVRDGLQSNEFLVGSYCKAQSGEMFFGGINGFNAFFPSKIQDNQNIPEIVITGFKIFNQEVPLDTAISEKKKLNLSWRDYSFSFEFVALDYIFPEKNQYAYKMEGFEDKWNHVGTRRFASYTNLPPGDYVFRVKGSNNDEVWNDTGTQIIIHIQPAFWQTFAFKIGVVLFILLAILIIFKIRVRSIKAKKEELEKLVKIRTAEVVKQKDEIETQRDHIALQKQEITDSIVYAKRIQRATLPTGETVAQTISDYFVLLKPRDIVSGDFYWFTNKQGKLIAVAADCTGHGVPGAFMSMLGVSFLNKIVNEKAITHPGEILDRLRENIIRSLKQKGYDNESRDGMDLALISIDLKKNTLQFAGANNPLYLVRDDKIEIVKADKMPIAIFDRMEPFTTHDIKLKKNDCVYIFSDGYADQFGGTRGKKFYYRRFRELLVEINHKPMKEQKKILNQTIEEWRGDLEQVDDILVIGVKI